MAIPGSARWIGLGVGLLAAGLPPALAQAPSADESGVLKGHLGPVLMGVFTPDGKSAITVSSDETVRMWNLETRTEVRNYPGHTGPLFCLTLSKDGRTLATGAYDNTLRIWDVPLGKPLVRLKGHEGAAGGLALSADGRLLITGGADKSIRLWNPAELAEISDPKQPVPPAGVRMGPASEIVLTAVRNDGNLIAGGTADGQIHLDSPFVEGSQGVLGTHPAGITGLAFHANNQQLISAGKDGQVRIWQLPAPPAREIPGLASAVGDLIVLTNQAIAVVATDDGSVRAIDANTGQTVREFPKGAGKVTALAIMPNNTLLAVADDKGGVRFFNFADAGPRGAIAAHEKAVRDVVFHPDNQTLSTAGADGWVKHWKIPDPAATEPAMPVQQWADAKAGVLAVSADGSKLFAGSAEGKILQWKPADGMLERTFEAHKGEVSALAVSPNGQQLLSGGADKTLKQWNPADGALLRSLELSAEIRGLSITSDSQRLLAACKNGEVHLLDTAGGGLLQTFSAGSTPAFAAWLNDNQSIVSGSTDKVLRVWKQSAVRVFSPHQKPIVDLALYNGGAQFLTAGTDGKVLMTDVNNGQPVRTFEGLTGEARAVAARADNQRIAAGSSDGKVFLWNAGDAKLLQTLEVPGEVTSLSFSPDNQKLAVATKDKILAIFGPPLPPMSPQPGTELVLHQKTSAENVLARIVFDRDNRGIWATDDGGNISQWAYASPVQTRQFNHGGPVYGVAITADGKTAVSSSTDQTVRIWDITTGQQKAAMTGHQGAVHAVALSPDESLIVSSGADRTVRLWDMAGGRQLKQLATFEETMYAVAVSPDGKTVAVGGADRKVHLINLLTGAIERTFEGHTDYVHSVSFNPAGNRLLSYGYAGQLRVWDPTNGKVLFEDRIGRIGNFAHYASDGTRVLLSNGDGTARVFELPAPVR